MPAEVKLRSTTTRKPKANAPFVCIEPWYAVASVRGESKELKDKKAIQKLEPNAVFECGFDLEII